MTRKSKSSEKKTTEKTPAVKVTVKGIICDGIKEGHTIARILKDVAKKKPESKADESHIKYYSGQLKRADEISEEVHEKYAGKRGAPSKEKAPAKKKSEDKAEKETPAKKKGAARKTKK